LLNITRGKNKVFFAGTLGFGAFYSYIFFSERGWGEAGSHEGVAKKEFSEGGKESVKSGLAGVDGNRRPFFMPRRTPNGA
jgi:hypothetical protein